LLQQAKAKRKSRDEKYKQQKKNKIESQPQPLPEELLQALEESEDEKTFTIDINARKSIKFDDLEKEAG
jgi:hypothetical protein